MLPVLWLAVKPSTSSPVWRLPVIAAVACPTAAAVSASVSPELPATGVDATLLPATKLVMPLLAVSASGGATKVALILST